MAPDQRCARYRGVAGMRKEPKTIKGGGGNETLSRARLWRNKSGANCVWAGEEGAIAPYVLKARKPRGRKSGKDELKYLHLLIYL